jgi:hypothetical protein
MVNKLNIKHILLIIIAFWIASNSCKAQSTYQKYDPVTRGVEYHIVKAQVESNFKTMQLLKDSKKNYSLSDKYGSITRSRIQGVYSSKENENFRLNQKAFLIMDANKIDNIEDYNTRVRNIKSQFPK